MSRLNGRVACRPRSMASRCPSSSSSIRRNDRWCPRGRPHRHGRESAGRHQVARNLRSAGGAPAAPGASRARKPGHPERLSAFEAAPLAGYADIVYNGLWFSPTRSAIDAFVQNIQPRVTGTIRLKLYKGDCRVVGRKSDFALYEYGLATYDAGDTFDHSAAEGFIKIWGLPVETAAKNARRRSATRSSARCQRGSRVGVGWRSS